MSKKILEQTKQEYMSVFNSLPEWLRTKLIMTSYGNKSYVARLRRATIKYLNDANHRRAKGRKVL